LSKTKKTAKKRVKEMQFSTRTESGDFQVKIRKLRKFLEQGYQLKITIQFKRASRRNTQNRGVSSDGSIQAMKDAIMSGLADISRSHGSPQDLGWRFVFILVPKEPKASAADGTASSS
jgi:translation initiation factor IF-3